jgi:hypothetical protein
MPRPSSSPRPPRNAPRPASSVPPSKVRHVVGNAAERPIADAEAPANGSSGNGDWLAEVTERPERKR